MQNIDQMAPWLGEEEKQAVAAYMDTGPWLTEFRKTQEFEAMIAAYVGSRHAIALSNGTVTLFAALAALGIGKGDEVIVPDYTMIASANAVVMAGATPVFVDVSADTLCLDLDFLEQAITPRTRGIMLVTLNGRFPDMERVLAIAGRHHLHLIEDAAQALGSRCGSKHLGTFGEIGSFSFSAPKIITTGQGGALVTDDPQLADKIRKVKDFGRQKAGVDYHESIGYNFKITDLQAVIGIEQMKKLDWRVARKKDMFGIYRSELEGVPGLSMIPTDLANTSPWFIDILVNDRTGLQAFLRERGIGTRPFYPAIHSQPPYGLSGNFPVTEDISARGLWLPSSSFLTDDDIRRVCADIREFCGTAGKTR